MYNSKVLCYRPYNQFWNIFSTQKEATYPLAVTPHVPLAPQALGKH